MTFGAIEVMQEAKARQGYRDHLGGREPADRRLPERRRRELRHRCNPNGGPQVMAIARQIYTGRGVAKTHLHKRDGV